jgi:hypothetical protein
MTGMLTCQLLLLMQYHEHVTLRNAASRTPGRLLDPPLGCPPAGRSSAALHRAAGAEPVDPGGCHGDSPPDPV